VSDWPVAAALLVVAGTALALALWGDDLRAWRRHPRLTVTIRPEPPDFQKVTLAADGEGPARDVYWARICIGNESRSAATNVEVRMLRLWRRNGSGAFEPDPDFLPISLLWARGHNVTTRVVHRDLPKFIDLLLVEPPSDPSEARFRFQTEVIPKPVRPGVWPTIKSAGTYRLDLAATSDEGHATFTTIEIEFSGRWTNDEAEMFGRELRLAVVGPRS
jgi:hypothetical protein